ncbi:2TM domain-containing protein [Spongiimicrobium salis]|uniref:2TM domain-containing protein n=1 Tax=Spongiimicrobium salis TaxID=1667022 RepID=UPI00374D0CC7
MENLDKESKYLRAKERVEAIKKFYSSLFSYIVFITLLGALNYYTNQWEYMWFLWAAFGWGIGIVVKAVKVFGTNVFMGRDWEERKIKEFMDKDQKQQRWN